MPHKPSAKTTQDMVRRLEDRLRAVGSIGRVLASGGDINALFLDLVPHISRLLRASRTSLFLYDEASGEIWSQAAEGAGSRQIRLKLGQGIAGWVAQERQPLRIADVYDDPRFNRQIDKLTGFRTKSMVAVPILNKESQLLGVVQVLNHEAGEFSADDVDLLVSIAQEAAYALDNARLTEQLRQQNAELRQALTELERARERQRDLDRLAIIGRMLASVAHDLNNPMTGIAIQAELMVDTGERSVRSQKAHVISALLSEMTAMMSDVLTFARGDSQLRRAPIDPAAVAREVVDSLATASKARGVNVTLEATSGVVRVDPGRVKRILYNLAKNAIDELRDGGELHISVAPSTHGLQMAVRDNGPGIPTELLGRLFEPFVTGGKENGTGLGLSIVKRFVDDHGGDIHVDTQTGVGTIFTIRLPERLEHES